MVDYLGGIFSNHSDLKSIILFFYLSGLALGVGGAWFLDMLLFKFSRGLITKGKVDLIHFISSFVFVGLTLLWISGLLFIAYYYLYTPDFIYNPKVWAKVAVVCVLSINGYFIHSYVLNKIENGIGKSFFDVFSNPDIKRLMFISVISFVSWLFPIALGVSETLNFDVPVLTILSYYTGTLFVGLLIANTIVLIITLTLKWNASISALKVNKVKRLAEQRRLITVG